MAAQSEVIYEEEARAKIIKWLESEILENTESIQMYTDAADKNRKLKRNKYAKMYEVYVLERTALVKEYTTLLECYKP